MTEIVRHRVASAGAESDVLTLGDPRNPPLVIVHGIRDVAASLLVIAEPLAEQWFVVLPDLRGHGDSDNSNHYSVWQFIYDLYRVIDALALATPVIIGHSLGGQIAAHHAAMFPEQVRALVIVEGLGPPARPFEIDADARLIAQRAQLLATMQLPEHSRPLPSIEFAADRLQANNPRLGAERAFWLARARHGCCGRRQTLLEIRSTRRPDLAHDRSRAQSHALGTVQCADVDRDRRPRVRILDCADDDPRLEWPLHRR